MPTPMTNVRLLMVQQYTEQALGLLRETSTIGSAMAPVKTRRTQEQRRAETRAKLLDAAIESLLEVGYAATTTRAVAQRAGVSSGAQTHHFPRRVDLVAAAVEHL